MKRFLVLLLCSVMAVSPALALELRFETPSEPLATNDESETAPQERSIQGKTVSVPEAVLDAGRVRKTVVFRGNKSARFAEFENLDLAPQVEFAKGLLKAPEIEKATEEVVNYADLPDVNDQAAAVEKVETKVTERRPNNPAITGYGRSRGEVYGALRLKRANDARAKVALMEKLDRFQVTPGRMQEKIARSDRNQDILN